MNLSARLMVAAGKGGVGMLCDHATYESVGDKLSFKALDPIRVKGKTEPIQIYEPSERDWKKLLVDNRTSSTDHSSSLESVVIGRDKEIAEITKVLNDLVEEGTSQIRVFEGDAGTHRSNFRRVGLIVVVTHV